MPKMDAGEQKKTKTIRINWGVRIVGDYVNPDGSIEKRKWIPVFDEVEVPEEE
jgi:hypothetical protein